MKFADILACHRNFSISKACKIWGKTDYHVEVLLLISIHLSVSLDINLPQICILGSQSVGKSSLIESISGVHGFN